MPSSRSRTRSPTGISSTPSRRREATETTPITAARSSCSRTRCAGTRSRARSGSASSSSRHRWRPASLATAVSSPASRSTTTRSSRSCETATIRTSAARRGKRPRPSAARSPTTFASSRGCATRPRARSATETGSRSRSRRTRWTRRSCLETLGAADRATAGAVRALEGKPRRPARRALRLRRLRAPPVALRRSVLPGASGRGRGRSRPALQGQGRRRARGTDVRGHRIRGRGHPRAERSLPAAREEPARVLHRRRPRWSTFASSRTSIDNHSWTDTMLHELGHGVYDLGFDDEPLVGVARHAPRHDRGVGAPLRSAGGRPRVARARPRRRCARGGRARGPAPLRAGRRAPRLHALGAGHERVRARALRRPRVRSERRLVGARRSLPAAHASRRPECCPDWAAKIHVAVAPVYYHTYLYGAIVALQIKDALRSAAGGLVERPEAGALLQREALRARGLDPLGPAGRASLGTPALGRLARPRSRGLHQGLTESASGRADPEPASRGRFSCPATTLYAPSRSRSRDTRERRGRPRRVSRIVPRSCTPPGAVADDGSAELCQVPGRESLGSCGQRGEEWCRPRDRAAAGTRARRPGRGTRRHAPRSDRSVSRVVEEDRPTRTPFGVHSGSGAR